MSFLPTEVKVYYIEGTFMRWGPKGLICHNTLQSVQIELEKIFYLQCDLLSISYFMKNIELLVNFWSLFCKIL